MPQTNLAVVLDDLDLTFIYPESYEPSNPNTNTFIDAIKKANKLPSIKARFIITIIIGTSLLIQRLILHRRI